MAKIRAKYKKFIVYGYWFCYGDSYWLLLDTKSTKRTGLDAIQQDDLQYKVGPF